MNAHKKNLLVTGPISSVGGHATYIKDLHRYSLRDYELRIFDTARDYGEKIVSGKSSLSLLVARVKRSVSAVFATLNHFVMFPVAVVRNRPSMLLITGGGRLFWEQWWFLLVAKIAGVRSVLHYHGPFEIYWRRSGLISKRVQIFTYGLLDRMWVLSKVDQDLCKSVLPKLQCDVVVNYIDPEEYPKDYPVRTSCADGVVKMLFIGGNDPARKGLPVLLEAAVGIGKQLDNLKFILSGGPTAAKMFSDLVDEACAGSFECLGWISNEQKKRLLSEADIIVLPSYEEGMPYLLIEAMASGMSVISTRIGAIPDLVVSDAHGVLIMPGDAQALMGAMGDLAKDSRRRELMGRANFDRIRQYYTKDIVFGRINCLLNELYGGQK